MKQTSHRSDVMSEGEARRQVAFGCDDERIRASSFDAMGFMCAKAVMCVMLTEQDR